jgi:hypothetical protein
MLRPDEKYLSRNSITGECGLNNPNNALHILAVRANLRAAILLEQYLRLGRIIL